MRKKQPLSIIRVTYPRPSIMCVGVYLSTLLYIDYCPSRERRTKPLSCILLGYSHIQAIFRTCPKDV